jgi:hypothetical protein
MLDSVQSSSIAAATIAALAGNPPQRTFGRRHRPLNEESTMSIGMILVIILVLALVGVIPAWPHSRSWGYGPTGGVGLIVLVLVVLLLLGRI